MSAIESKLRGFLVGLDQELFDYIVGVLDDMPASELRSAEAVADAIGPFLLDSAFCG